MHSHVEWIGENIGAESPRARTPLEIVEETEVYCANDESFPQGWPITTEHAS
jgi:hypothetical protein